MMFLICWVLLSCWLGAELFVATVVLPCFGRTAINTIAKMTAAAAIDAAATILGVDTCSRWAPCDNYLFGADMTHFTLDGAIYRLYMCAFPLEKCCSAAAFYAQKMLHFLCAFMSVFQ